jgi:F-type H+-transporting ATPase subunit gamma
MASAREMRMRIRSVKNISQVTRALEAVSASKVRRAIKAVTDTHPYATKAWQVLTHIAAQPGREQLHPLLTVRPEVKNTLAVIITGDRGLAGAYNSNIIRFISQNFDDYKVPVKYIAIGRKGRDLLFRRRKQVLAEFSNLPAAPSFADVSAIGRLAVDAFLKGEVDEVFLVYTNFYTMARQTVEMQKLLDEIIPRFTALQVYQAILESQASEHAARMVAMRNATDNAHELVGALQLAYNKVRQQAITNDILDIVGGAEALAQ